MIAEYVLELRGCVAYYFDLSGCNIDAEADLGRALELADGNISRAARLAERNRTDFYKLLSRYGVDPTAFKERAQQA